MERSSNDSREADCWVQAQALYVASVEDKCQTHKSVDLQQLTQTMVHSWVVLSWML